MTRGVSRRDEGIQNDDRDKIKCLTRQVPSHEMAQILDETMGRLGEQISRQMNALWADRVESAVKL